MSPPRRAFPLAKHAFRPLRPRLICGTQGYRLYTNPAALVRGGRRVRLRYAANHPWATLLVDALTAFSILDNT